jgi:hypothetical protein
MSNNFEQEVKELVSEIIEVPVKKLDINADFFLI